MSGSLLYTNSEIVRAWWGPYQENTTTAADVLYCIERENTNIYSKKYYKLLGIDYSIEYSCTLTID